MTGCMGYMLHHVIIVASWNSELLVKAHSEAVNTFGAEQVTHMTESTVNGVWSFMVGPDGSKEGWPESAAGDSKREAYCSWLSEQRYEDGSTSLKWAELALGDDRADDTDVVRAWGMNAEEPPGGPVEVNRFKLQVPNGRTVVILENGDTYTAQLEDGGPDGVGANAAEAAFNLGYALRGCRNPD